jgi:uncharacterized damage-inducible protein DinB
MPKSKLTGLLFNAWDDADRVYANLTIADALKRHEGGSSFAWTLRHMTEGVDNWVNVTLQGGKANATLAQEREKFGRTGDAGDWEAIRAAVAEVRNSARAYLENLTDADLDQIKVPPIGRWQEAPLRYYISRAIAHHYFHIGEVAAKRDRLGHKVGDYPGPLQDAM